MTTPVEQVPKLRLPRFSSPSPRLDPPLEIDANDPTTRPAPDGTSPGPRPSPDESPESSIPSPAGADRPTRRSSPGKPVDVQAVSAALSGFILVIAGFCAWALRRRGWELRVPDEKERADVAEPLARIGARHLDLSMLSPDVADATQAVAASAAYCQTSPLSRGVRIEPNIPPQPTDEEMEAL